MSAQVAKSKVESEAEKLKKNVVKPAESNVEGNSDHDDTQEIVTNQNGDAKKKKKKKKKATAGADGEVVVADVTDVKVETVKSNLNELKLETKEAKANGQEEDDNEEEEDEGTAGGDAAGAAKKKKKKKNKKKVNTQ